MTGRLIALMLTVLALAGAAHGQDLPVFPGAEGWGSTTPGGRGGQIIFVTSLDDSGRGTLREAIQTPGPRTVLFRVSGLIELQSPLAIGGGWDPAEGDNPYSYLTIAGQSAPGGGVCITGRTLILIGGVHDVVIRDLRIRSTRESADDCISFINGVHDVVVDHCSLSWGTDENVGFGNDAGLTCNDVTICNCIIAEGLWNAGHAKGAHSMGLLAARGADRLSIHHNFFTGNNARNPQLDGGNTDAWRDSFPLHPIFDVRNNLIYNWGQQGTAVLAGACANVVGNVYRPGPDSPDNPYILHASAADAGGSLTFVEDNIGPREVDDPWQMVYFDTALVPDREQRYGYDPESYRALEPFEAPAVTMVPAAELADSLLPHVGARPRDATDARLVEECRSGTGQMGAPHRTQFTPVDAPEPGEPAADGDLDGMPDAWETERGLDPTDPADAWQDRDGDGYPNLEEYLNALVAGQ